MSTADSIEREPDSCFALFDVAMETVQTRPFAGGSVAYFTTRSPDKLTANEDAIGIIPVQNSAGVLLIADGCGGQANGQLASRMAIEAIFELVAGYQMSTESSAVQNSSQLRPLILDGFEIATQRVKALGGGAATTLIALEFNQGLIRTYHAGDSQILLVGGRGKVKLQTGAHSPVGYALESGMLTEGAALEHEDRHLVSNVIGGGSVHIEMGLPRKMAPRDTIVLGSDGLFDNLRQAELVSMIRSGKLQQAGENLRAKVQSRMSGEQADGPSKPDDLSFILFRCS